MKCGNCGQDHQHLPDVCILAALGRVLCDRGYEPADVEAVMAKVDTDEFWDMVGPIVDWLEDTLNEEVELEDA